MLDIEMPIMNGIECMEKIREYCNEKKIVCPPIISVTANDIHKHNKYKEMGFDYVMEKPIKEEELDRVLGIIRRKSMINVVVEQ